MDYGILSLLPAVIALVLAFITRNAIFSILVGILGGILLTGQNLLTGFSSVTQNALGNADFIWVVSIEIFIGIMIALYQKSGAMDSFSKLFTKREIKRRGAQVLAWLLGIFIFFSDYFSPLYVGTVMRNITDKARVSREKLAYICDSTSAPVASLIPFSSWGVYMAGLLVSANIFADKTEATTAVIKMVPYNIYSLLSVAMVGFIALKIIPDFGPMKKAELRAQETGEVYAKGSTPLIGKELEEIKASEKIKPHLFLHFFMPAIIVIATSVGTYIYTGSAKTLEGFILATFYQFILLLIQRAASIDELIEASIQGIKGVMGAILILALAYSLNTISKDLGTANFVIRMTKDWITPSLLVMLTFLICSFIAFFTGTSWGVYAIMTPIAVPIAVLLSGGTATNPLIYATIGAIMSGGVFGDHCSPLSDTSILSSLGAGSDHIDHVKTQLPYALVVGAISSILYFIIGISIN